MSLLPHEKTRLEFLIWKQQFGGGLDFMEQQEFRDLLARQSPAARDFTTEQLVGLGLLLLAAWAIFKKK